MIKSVCTVIKIYTFIIGTLHVHTHIDFIIIFFYRFKNSFPESIHINVCVFEMEFIPKMEKICEIEIFFTISYE